MEAFFLLGALGDHIVSFYSRAGPVSSAKLKTIKLWGCEGLENIMIDALNLQSFSLFNTTSSSEINIVDALMVRV